MSEPKRPSVEQLAQAKALAAVLARQCNARLAEVEQLLGVRHRCDLHEIVTWAKQWGLANMRDFDAVPKKLRPGLIRIFDQAPALEAGAGLECDQSPLLDVRRLDRLLTLADQAARMSTCGEEDGDVQRSLRTRTGQRRYLSHWCGCNAPDCRTCQRRVQIHRDLEFRPALRWLDGRSTSTSSELHGLQQPSDLRRLRFLLSALPETETPPAFERRLLAASQRLWPPRRAEGKG